MIVYNFDGIACTGSRHGINGKLRGRPTMDWAPSNARLSRTQWTCKWRLNLLPQSKKVPNSETLWLSLTLCAFLFFKIFSKLLERNTIVIILLHLVAVQIGRESTRAAVHLLGRRLGTWLADFGGRFANQTRRGLRFWAEWITRGTGCEWSNSIAFKI